VRGDATVNTYVCTRNVDDAVNIIKEAGKSIRLMLVRQEEVPGKNNFQLRIIFNKYDIFERISFVQSNFSYIERLSDKNNYC
jgi:hypothetical protein